MDRDEKKLEAILAIKYKVLTVKEQKVFLPFSINLDPYIKKVIRDEYVSLAALECTGWFTDQISIPRKAPAARYFYVILAQYSMPKRI